MHGDRFVEEGNRSHEGGDPYRGIRERGAAGTVSVEGFVS